MISFLTHTYGMNKEQAFNHAQEMMKSQAYFYRLNQPVDQFESNATLFQFRADIHNSYILNQDFSLKKSTILDPLQFSIEFLDIILKIYGDYAICDGKAICFEDIALERYHHFVTLAAQLKFISFEELKDRIVKAFFLNIRNALVYHIALAFRLGLPKETHPEKSIYKQAGYSIGNCNFTLYEIDNAVLRCNYSIAFFSTFNLTFVPV